MKERPIALAIGVNEKVAYLTAEDSKLRLHVLVKNAFESKVLQYGMNPIMAQSGGKVAIVFDHGLCQSAVYFNNNDLNKCNFFKYSHFKALYNVSSIINLLVTDFARMEEYVKEGEWLSGCSPNTTFSKAAIGKSPRVSLDGQGTVALGYGTTDYFGLDMMSTLFCGSPAALESPESRVVQLQPGVI